MIRFDNITLQRGNKCLLEKASATLNPSERIGLIGLNGSGKSTLLALLRGQHQTEAGTYDLPIGWRIAHVAQETPAQPCSARDYVIDGDVVLRQIQQRIEQTQASGDGHAQAEAHAAYADADGYTAQARADSLLLGLGFSVAQLEQPVANFSGGWRMRLNLAQALMCPSDLLLLDEPTNHLDLDAIVWLEDNLTRYRGTLIIISHDREFLDNICDTILHLHARKLTRYRGNYSSFEEQRVQQLALQQSAYSKQQDHIAHLQKFIDRFKAKASKARQAQSRVKALEKIQRLTPIHASESFSFNFRQADAAPNPLMLVEAADCGYHSAILKNITLSIQNDQRIGLLGANGQGKSTLIKSLVGELPLLKGKRLVGKGLLIGYFSQHQLETLRADDTPLQHLMRCANDTREQVLRDFLGSFNFGGEHLKTLIGGLSGGEKARLALAAIVWQKPNLLLLDEPTNHLDIETREALTLALAEFEGALIVVSHDRHLLRATTEEFLLVHDGCVENYDGDLDEYRDWMLKQKATQISLRREDNKKTKAISPATAPKSTAQRKALEAKISKLEKKLAQLTEDKQTLEEKLSDNQLYAPENASLLKQLLAEQKNMSAEIESIEKSWLEQQEQLESL